MKNKNRYGLRRVPKLLIITGLIMSVAAGYYAGAACAAGYTVLEWFEKFNTIINNPVSIENLISYYNGRYTFMAIGVMLFIFAFVLLYYMAGSKNYMPGREYGDAHYADNEEVNRQLSKPLDKNNMENLIRVKVRRKGKWLWHRK